MPESYYALGHRENSFLFSLYFRYRDLEPKDGQDDYSELSNPDWSLETSNLTALIQVYRHPRHLPTSLSNIIDQGNRNAREVPTDWEGWQKIKRCDDCPDHIYFNAAWQGRGIVNVGCYEVKDRDPIYLACSANDVIDGLSVAYYFPVIKRQHLEEFRARTNDFIQKLAADAETQCVGR